MPGTRKLGRPTAHRKSMLRGLVTLLLDKGSVITTVTRAKEVRSMAEKMITLGKTNTLASRRAALAYITSENVVSKLFNEIAPKYEDRNGGYTQLFKLGPRRGDAAEMALIRLTVETVVEEKKKGKNDEVRITVTAPSTKTKAVDEAAAPVAEAAETEVKDTDTTEG